MKSFCSTCSRPTNQAVIAEKVINESDDFGMWWSDTNYQIIQCQGCDTISFRRLYDDITRQGYAEEDTTTQELFPKRGSHSRPLKPFKNIPGEIKKIYLETIEAYNNQLTLLCGVGVRAILESICKNKGVEEGVFTNVDGAEVKSKALNGKIYGLAAKGFLTSDNAMILHELRFLGNAAVHELSSPTIESLQIAIEIIEHVIDNIYELSYKAGKLMEKRTGSA